MTTNLRVPWRSRVGASRIRGLVIDQDAETRHLVGMFLDATKIETKSVSNGEAALQAIHKDGPFSFVLIDPKLDDIDGLVICTYIKEASDAPMIVYSDNHKEDFIVSAFDAGADDYLPKPVMAVELLAHIVALISLVERFGRIIPSSNPTRDKILIEPRTGKVIKGRRDIRLSTLQFEVLQYLMNNVGRVVSVEELLTNVWGHEDPHGGQNLVQVTIHRIREQIEDDPAKPDFLFTVRNMGYRFG